MQSSKKKKNRSEPPGATKESLTASRRVFAQRPPGLYFSLSSVRNFSIVQTLNVRAGAELAVHVGLESGVG